MKTCLALIFATILAQAGFGADRGDYYLSGGGGWDFTRRSRFAQVSAGYLFWNEIGTGLHIDQTELYFAPGPDLRWMIEPFEVMILPQYAFWSENGGSWHTQLSLGVRYLFLLTPALSSSAEIRVVFPEHKQRSFGFGFGLRYLFRD